MKISLVNTQINAGSSFFLNGGHIHLVKLHGVIKLKLTANLKDQGMHFSIHLINDTLKVMFNNSLNIISFVSC